jgi:hypothetical protein
MEYFSMNEEEALGQQLKFEHLINTEFTEKSTGDKFVVIAVLIMPSDTSELMKMTELITLHYDGINQENEIRALADKYTKDEFTVVLFSKTIFSKNPGTKFLPIQYLAKENGDLELGFGIL